MSITRLTARKDIRTHLQHYDRIWAAYAWADLAPGLFEDCQWYASPEALLLIYNGLQPPIALGMGHSAQLAEMVGALPAGRYTLSWPAAALSTLQASFAVQSVPMFRMLLDRSTFKQPNTRPHHGDIRPLSIADAPAVATLIAPSHGTEEDIDGFAPAQMADDIFFGAYIESELVAVAGTHVYAPDEGIADIGNVYVRHDHRRQGWGLVLAALVTAKLIEQGIETIFLNVRQSNQTAQRIYQKLGYQVNCPFYEGYVQT